ncbi:hypothetical protein LPJ55_002474 [Coemansia sp. RSA 990]|nr:hypothetical protein LPJ79_002988 [Coemansia sp. RSA 1821]KAJ1873218.1 hypothetical protein LPJ55_002474 [Coemansia sp. RSA 990]
MRDLKLADLDLLLASTSITTTEELTRALRSGSQKPGQRLPLQQLLALAWAVFDDSTVGDQYRGTMQRLSAILVRKDEMLSDWIFSTILHELKANKSEKYILYRDPAAIALLTSLLESIGERLPAGSIMEIQNVLSGPIMPLFLKAFADGSQIKDARYAVEIARLWKFIVRSTGDGLEKVSTHPDQLIQLFILQGNIYMEVCSDRDSQLENSLREAVLQTAYAIRRACETSLNQRKMFELFDESLVFLCLRIIGSSAESAQLHEQVLDMLHVCLFSAECISRLVAVLTNKPTKMADGEKSYVMRFFDLISAAIGTHDSRLRAEYALALPGLLDRYLQAATLACSETRSMATTTLGLSAIAANPLNLTLAETSSSCLAMYLFMYNLLSPLKADEKVLAASNQLAKAYFGNQCFGTVSNSSVVSGDLYQRQADSLSEWLEAVIRPILEDCNEAASVMLLALEGIDLALDAGPELVQKHSERVLQAFSRIPTGIADQSTAVLSHLIQTFKKARKLDLLVSSIAIIQESRPCKQSDIVNLLIAPIFLDELGRAVSQAMPYVQVGTCISTLADSIAAKASMALEGGGSKRRRLSRKKSDTKVSQTITEHENAIEMLTTVTATFVLASITTVNTEHQCVQFSRLLADTYKQLMDALPIEECAWERLLLHYVLMEAGSRLDGTERWLESCMYPELVNQYIMPASIAENPRTATLGMVVAFQTAAHWSVFESSMVAGIIPESVVVQINASAAAAATRRMISSFFPGKCLSLSVAAGQQASGWKLWDGQAHTISNLNFMSAQWALLSDWLELACEYADSKAIRNIALRIVTGLSQSPIPTRGDAHALLDSADFFEILAIRHEFVPAIAEHALLLFKQQVENIKAESKLPKLANKVAAVFELMTSQNSTDTTKSKQIETIGSKLVDILAKSQSKSTRGLTAEQASMWYYLLQALLRFPDAYWEPAYAHVLLALVLTVDIGIAPMCREASGAESLRVLAYGLLERWLQSMPSVVTDMSSSIEGVVIHWIAVYEQAKSESLTKQTQNLLSVLMRVLAQAGFGQSKTAVDSVNRKLCVALLDRLDHLTGPNISTLVLDMVNMVSISAQQYAAKAATHQNSEKWASLLQPRVDSIAHKIVAQLAAETSDSAIDMQAACGVGLYTALQRLYSSTTGVSLPVHVDISVGIDLSRKTCIGNCFDLAMCVYSIHTLSMTSESTAAILAFLVRQLTADALYSADKQQMITSILEAITGITSDKSMSFADAIIFYAAEPLLKKLDEKSFAAAFTSFLQTMMLGTRAPSVCSKFVQAIVRLAHKHGGSEQGIQRQRTVQRRIGTVLAAAHSYVRDSCNTGKISDVLCVVNELVVVSGLRCTMNDIGEALSIIDTVLVLPLCSGLSAEESDGLFCLVCRTLSGIIRRHTNIVLDSISLLTGTLRLLLHAFVTPALPRQSENSVEIDASSTSWIIAAAPFSATCAEAYSRMLNDLCQARKSDFSANKQSTAEASLGAEMSGDYVKMTKGTGAANAASVLTAYVPYILAEYCVIQAGGGSTYGSRNVHGKWANTTFRGLSWRQMPAVSLGNTESTTSKTQGTVSSPAIREALLPGWYALLDIMTNDDQQMLLTLLAGQPTADRQWMSNTVWPSVFGPGRHDGASEILKGLYQSYNDFYKYTGRV